LRWKWWRYISVRIVGLSSGFRKLFNPLLYLTRIEVSEIERKRRKILEEIRKLGIDPYPHSFKINASIQDVIREKNMRKTYVTAGRIMQLRDMGKITFINIENAEASLQCFLSVENLKEDYAFFRKYVGRGDIIGVKGRLFYTKKGELTLNVKEFKLLTKALLPPPQKWKGIVDEEIRYRKRYLDLIMNQRTREIFKKRALIIREIRNFLNEKGFLEFETPILQPVYGGAAAKPFITHVNYLDEDWYLQISPELYLKRLVIGGFERVYTVARNFRNESVDVRHNPEFTMLEVYQAYADYNDVMKLIEDLFLYVHKKVFGTPILKLKDGSKFDLRRRWRRLTMLDALKEYADLDVEGMSDKELKRLLKENGIELPFYNRGLAIAELFEKLCEHELIQPTHIIDHPRETTPLCKLHRKNESLIERVESYINGVEHTNGYTELNDPILQEKFFLKEMELRKKGYEEAHPLDMDFVEALKYGMPPTGGVGIGVDRMIMTFLGVDSIKEVIPFPMVARGFDLDQSHT